jgi:signal transduction histidine kinase
MLRGRSRAVVVAIGIALLGVIGWVRWSQRRPPIPRRTLLIGFDHNPPYQVRQASGPPTGLVVETVAEAARRAGLPLEWREIPGGPEQALAAGTGSVDLWPLVTDLPERHGKLYISAPWLQSQHVLVLRGAQPMPDQEFSQRVGITAVRSHARLLGEAFPNARPVEYRDGIEALAHLCAGDVAATFLESRIALAVLRDRPPACDSVELRAQLLPGSHQLGIGSTFAASAAADRIRSEITRMADDGTLAVLFARHSFFGLNDTRATYDLLEAQARNRNLLWVIAGLAGALTLTLWLAWSLRRARQATEGARRLLEGAVSELEKRNSELERFTYAVSHDLRSPLVTVMGFLGAVEDAALGGRTDHLRRDMERIRGAAERMDRLLKELLQLSRVGRVAPPPETVPFGELVREASTLVAGRLRERGVTLEVAEGLPAVHGDRSRLVELVQNLLDNAAKFMGDQPQPRIEVGARTSREGPVFFVRDNGRGIDPRFHEKVFGLFDRLDPEDEGTGIGLALVRRIVETHGGRVWVESEGTGRGSTFCFTVPSTQGAPLGVPAEPSGSVSA